MWGSVCLSLTPTSRSNQPALSRSDTNKDKVAGSKLRGQQNICKEA
jgi:hypothetical protein